MKKRKVLIRNNYGYHWVEKCTVIKAGNGDQEIPAEPVETCSLCPRSRQPLVLVRKSVVPDNWQISRQIPEFQDYLRPAPASKMPVRGDIVPDQGIAPKPAPTNQDKVRPVVPPPTPLPLDFVKNDANAPTHAPKVQHPANAASILQPIAPTNIVADHTTGPKSNPDTHQQAHSKDAFQTTVRASNAPMGVKAPSRKVIS